MTRPVLLAFALGTALSGAPTWAQTSPSPGSPAAPPQATSHPADLGTATINPTSIPPSERNPLLTDNSDVRISKLIGTEIYNKEDKKIGSVDDVLAGANGQLQVIVATNSKRVAVPWDKVQFGDAKLNSDNKVLMLDDTQQTLNNLPPYTPKKQSNGKG